MRAQLAELGACIASGGPYARLGAVPRPPRNENQLALLDALAAARESDGEERGYLARVFAQVALPYKDPGKKLDVWAKKNGNVSLLLRPGFAEDNEGKLVSLGFPFGVYPRLLMHWLCTEAVLRRSPQLEIGPSLSEFMRSLGAGRSGTGGRTGSITRLRDQMNRLFQAEITIKRDEVLEDGSERNRGLRLNVVDAWDLTWAAGGRSSSKAAPLAGSTIHLSPKLYEEIINHPVPLDMEALRALSTSPMCLDIYAWLAHRLSYLSKPTRVSWAMLREQLGTNVADTKQGRAKFKKIFTDNLAIVLHVYKDANVDIADEGVVLRPSLTHVPMVGMRNLRSRSA